MRDIFRPEKKRNISFPAIARYFSKLVVMLLQFGSVFLFELLAFVQIVIKAFPQDGARRDIS